MSAVSTPEQASGSRREQLLAIAARLFAEKGFKNTTVRDIADAAGILSGSLYHHFDSKESMVDEILSTFQDGLFAQYDEILASDEDARTKLERAVRVSFEAIEQHGARGRDLPERGGLPRHVRAVRLPRRPQHPEPPGVGHADRGGRAHRRAPQGPRRHPHLPLHPRHRVGRRPVVPPRPRPHPHRCRRPVRPHPPRRDLPHRSSSSRRGTRRPIRRPNRRTNS